MILTGHREAVRDYVASRIRDLYNPPQDLYEAIGVAREGRIVGGVLYSQYRELAPGQHDIVISATGEVGWLTRTTLRALMAYPFEDLTCIRMTAFVAPSNKQSRLVTERLGFKLEGKIRDGLGSGRSLLIYGLLKSEAMRWLK